MACQTDHLGKFRCWSSFLSFLHGEDDFITSSDLLQDILRLRPRI